MWVTTWLSVNWHQYWYSLYYSKLGTYKQWTRDQGTRGPMGIQEVYTPHKPLLVVLLPIHFLLIMILHTMLINYNYSASEKVSTFVDHSHTEQWAYKSIISPRCRNYEYLIWDLILNLPLYDRLAPRPHWRSGARLLAWIVKTFVCNSGIQAVPLPVLFNFCRAMRWNNRLVCSLLSMWMA